MKVKQNKQRQLRPKLRFPEFRDKWNENSLEALCDSISSGKDNRDSDGSYDLYGSTGIIGKTSNDTYRGTFILIARVGANAGLLTKANGKFGVTDNTLVIQLINPKFVDFIFYYLDSLDLNKLIFGSGQPLITGGQLKALPFFVPSDLEQQKIADCLSSLDELIAAQTQKLSTLKTHKKGLMQQLFPAEGETLPKLRFPDFRDAGEWKERQLGDFLNESRIPGSKGNVAKKITVKLWGNGVYEKNEAIQGSINTQYFRRKAGQFIYSKLDFLNQAFGIIPSSLDNYESTVDLPCFDIADGLDSVFLLEYVKRKDFYQKKGETADGSRKAKRIHAETFLSFSVILPKLDEQKIIADCLSSLDDLITAHTQKLATLKTHKKGLMQQLFPNTPTVSMP